MAEVELLVQAAAVEIEDTDPAYPDAQHCLRAYYAELDTRFESGFDADELFPASESPLRPPHGLLVVARISGQPVGCGALWFAGEGVAEIKRMWVAGSTRGTGLGKRLLGELEARASARGTRLLRLETNRALTEAINLYQSAGFTEVPPFSTERYVHHWFEKDLTRDR
jgi:GNAT superfamily N-acetyltransferase